METPADRPFESLRFRHPWRPYQKRVLDAVEDHLSDKRIHLVAAPGAGKTILGLEVFRILGKPTLVLSPTRVIRDQWIDRLKDFLEADDGRQPDWVSNTIKEPRLLTSITYQALHAKFAEELSADPEEEILLLEEDQGLKEEEVNSFLKTLEDHDFQVLILDEAHHLRAEWWRALERVCDRFPDLTLVSLTATPPYDSQGHEWARYEQLCGPIDEEISVPELVKAGTLCAHQDFLWACNATASEKKQIEEYDRRVSTLCNTLFENREFEAIVLSHPWLHSTDIEQDVIRDPEIAIAILSFIKSRGLPDNEELMALLDLSNEDIPELGRHWWQKLVETVLFSRIFEHDEEQEIFVTNLKKQLRASELLHKRELSLERSRRLERSLSLSSSKVDACVAIHQLEHRTRGEGLRQVILTDYIRDEELTSKLKTGEINLGAWPVFKALASSTPIPDQVALLTGRISIIPSDRLDSLLRFVDRDQIKAVPMGSDGKYHKISGPLNQLTGAFTALLMEGEIKVLVGTRSLLGEGWDAPAVNSLVLASSVGSFMLTNQMRGRAIRINPEDPGKISSIWHLTAINPSSYAGWSDFYNLTKRFDTFVGLSEKELTIESGFARMNAKVLQSGLEFGESVAISANNRQMRRRFEELETVAIRWSEALTLDESARIIPSVKAERAPQLSRYLLRHSFAYILGQVTAALAAVVVAILYSRPRLTSNFLLILLLGIVGALIYTLPKTIAVIKTVFRFLPIDGSLKQIGRALAESMCRTGFIETSIRRMRVNVTQNLDGTFYVSLSGCTFYESSLFADLVAEILAPIDNPRYLVVREGEFFGRERTDYHAVPMKFAARKETASIFHEAWLKYVSSSELLYTRTPEGRRELLKARMKAFSSTFRNEIERQDRWQ
ncbi:MAG: DEAD/DEAH box helicase family protein [Aridibacter famidurans]|nr:DEAD/DEAH box helicase family protein [Aridibacter famidurans]